MPFPNQQKDKVAMTYANVQEYTKLLDKPERKSKMTLN